ncbi:MAG: Hsp20/alpha crystallin family protein [Candidatus Sericytochromatia bacterium]|nr:Hsp20/alpha crystallin family protein [Candidatus Tanganyikabacteria bacterium]
MSRHQGPRVSPLLLRLLEELGHGLDQADRRGGAVPGRGLAPWEPPVDIHEQAEAFVVQLDVPGLKQEDLGLQVEGRHLLVTGERLRFETEGSRVLTGERPHGRFSRQVPLPADVAIERIRATLKDGVLSVWLPRVEVARPRTIPIDTSED